jgi:hypothetical protein
MVVFMSSSDEWRGLPAELCARIVNLSGSGKELFRYVFPVIKYNISHEN